MVKGRLKSAAGFTLAELLTVVAIIGILVTIGIPIFSDSLETSRAEICRSNRASAEQAITTAMMFSETKTLTKNEAEDAAKVAVGDLSGICPSGGKCTVAQNTDGIWKVTCSKHCATAMQTLNANIQDVFDKSSSINTKDPNSNVLTTVVAYFKNRANGSTIDSTGPNFGVPIKEALQKALDITDEFDFKMCKEKSDTPNTYVLNVYISEPLDEKVPGNKVTVTGYQFAVNGDIMTLIKKGEEWPDAGVVYSKNPNTNKNDMKTLAVTGYPWGTAEVIPQT